MRPRAACRSSLKRIGLEFNRIRGLSHMRVLSDDERNLLRFYCERDRVINIRDRTPAHQHLLGIGYIKERSVSVEYLLISVTDAGRKALRSPS